MSNSGEQGSQKKVVQVFDNSPIFLLQFLVLFISSLYSECLLYFSQKVVHFHFIIPTVIIYNCTQHFLISFLFQFCIPSLFLILYVLSIIKQVFTANLKISNTRQEKSTELQDPTITVSNVIIYSNHTSLESTHAIYMWSILHPLLGWACLT